MAEITGEVAKSIEHIELLLKELLDLASNNLSRTRTASTQRSGRNISPEEGERAKKRQLVLEQEIAAQQERINELQKELESSLEKTNKKIVLKQEIQEQINILNEYLIELQETQIKLAKSKLREGLEAQKLSTQDILVEKKKIEKLEEELELFKEKIRYAEQHKKQVNELRQSTSDLLTKITGLSMSWQEMASVKFFKSLKESLAGPGILASLKELGKGILDVFNITNLLGNGVELVMSSWRKSIFVADELRAKFNQATGTTGQYTTQILELRETYSQYVLNIEDSFKAYETLMTKLSGFRELNRDIQQEIAGHAAMMDKLGVSYDLTSNFLEHTNLVLGMTYDEAYAVQGQFVKLADDMKMTASELIKGFNEASKSLAVYGKDAPQIFANVAKFADKAGISVKSLLKMTQEFDSFEKAAGQVGKLNAMLGGSYLSTVDMLNASEDERIRKIKESIDLAGVQFDQMGKYQKLYITQTLGLQNVDEAARLLGGSLADLDAQLAANNLTQEEASRRAQKFSTIGKKLEAILQNIVFAIEPIIDGLHWLLDLLSDLVGWAKKNTALFWGIVGVLALLGIALQTLTTGLFGAGTAAATMAPAVATTGTAATAATSPMIGFAAAAMGVGVAVAAIIGSIALLVGSFALLIKVASESNVNILELGAGVALFAGSLALLGTVFPVALLGALALAAGFVALGLGLLFIDEDDINALSSVFKNLSSVFETFDLTIFDSIVSGLEKVAEAIDGVDESKMFSFGYMFNQVGQAIAGPSNTASQRMSAMVTAIDQATSSTNTAASSASSIGAKQLAETIKQNNQTTNNKTVNRTEKREIVLVLNEREIGRYIDDYLDNKLSLSRT